MSRVGTRGATGRATGAATAAGGGGTGGGGTGGGGTGGGGTGGGGTGGGGIGARVITEPRWRLFFDLLFAVSMGLGVLGLALNLAQGRSSPAAVALSGAICALAVGLWLTGLRHRAHPRLAWLLTACVLTLVVLSDGPIFLMLSFVALAVLTVEVGVLRAAVVAFLAGPFLGVSAWISYRDQADTSPLGFAIDGLFVSLILGLAVILGALLLYLEQTRQAALTANADLALANERLRETMSLERDLVLAEERARSSHELHDGLGARLTVTSMSLDYALRMRERDPELAWAEVSRAAEGNRETLDHMRVWVRALSPPQMASDQGGAAAFEAIADSFRGTGLSVRVQHEGPTDSLPPKVAALAYRLVQEGLTNALRHAGATEVTIALVQDAEEVRISVLDDGTGSTVWAATPSPAEGFGLRGLRERATELGGILTAGPGEDGGFELTAVLPLAGQHEPGGRGRVRGRVGR